MLLEDISAGDGLLQETELSGADNDNIYPCFAPEQVGHRVLPREKNISSAGLFDKEGESSPTDLPTTMSNRPRACNPSLACSDTLLDSELLDLSDDESYGVDPPLMHCSDDHEDAFLLDSTRRKVHDTVGIDDASEMVHGPTDHHMDEGTLFEDDLLILREPLLGRLNHQHLGTLGDYALEFDDLDPQFSASHPDNLLDLDEGVFDLAAYDHSIDCETGARDDDDLLGQGHGAELEDEDVMAGMDHENDRSYF